MWIVYLMACLAMGHLTQGHFSSYSPGVRFSQSETPLQVNGIFPGLTATAASGPIRSECGIGALMPWNDKLYMVSYLSSQNAGTGTGLYKIYPNFTMDLIVHHNSTYANRLIHRHSNQIIIGAWAIDLHDNVKTFKHMLHLRGGATAEHLRHPKTMVYMLDMEGALLECNVYTMHCKKLFDLVKALHIPIHQGEQQHFKAAHSMDGKLLVCSNTFTEKDFLGTEHGGRFAQWDGKSENWTILEETAFVEVTGRRNFGKVIYGLGWDFRSVILKVFDPGFGKWQTYRLPKGSHAYDHLWQTEWPRIREVETERYLMDMHGLFYELSPLGWAGSTWGVRPISRHLRMIPDYASFRGTLVLAGNQVSSIRDNNVVTGQAQSGLWFGKTDDLWSFGKPQGWGAVWRTDTVVEGAVSDPYLMTGFDKKILHLILHDGLKQATFEIQADVTGASGKGHRKNEDWVTVEEVKLTSGYNYFTFPSGFSAHWVRVKLVSCENSSHGKSGSCNVTAYFHYT